MKRPITNLSGILLVLATTTFPLAAEPFPRSLPEPQGVSSEGLLDFVSALDAQIEGMHGVMALRHGRVIAEGWWKPYTAEHNHVLYSLSKSFTSTAVGFAVAEGRLSIDDPVLDHFAGDAPTDPSANLKAMRVRDLLTMSTGHQDEPPIAPDTVCAKSFLAQPVPHLPGTHFKYNTAATFMQSALVQKVTGQTVLDYLTPRLFEPLGIGHPVWDRNFQGICLGGYGLRVRTEDIAKLGQFYLQNGEWKGRQLLPASWVEQATAKQVSNGSNPDSDWNQGYGFQFWRCRHNAFRGDGAFGQYCIVMPDLDAVIAINSGVRDMQAVLNVVWDRFLPACQASELPANPGAATRLRSKLASLEVSRAPGEPTSQLASRVVNRRYVFAANDSGMQSVELIPDDAGRTLTVSVQREGKEMRFRAGFDKWQAGRLPLSGGALAEFPDEPVAATCGWTAGDTLTIKLCAIETPFHQTWNLRFEGDQVRLDSEANVAFGSTRQLNLVGQAE